MTRILTISAVLVLLSPALSHAKGVSARSVPAVSIRLDDLRLGQQPLCTPDGKPCKYDQDCCSRSCSKTAPFRCQSNQFGPDAPSVEGRR
jgi:hypothetical protein